MSSNFPLIKIKHMFELEKSLNSDERQYKDKGYKAKKFGQKSNFSDFDYI